MDENDETPSNTHKEKQDLMQKALDDIMKNGPKLRLGHVPAPGKRFTNHSNQYLLNSRGPIVLLKDGLVLDAKFSIVIGRGN